MSARRGNRWLVVACGSALAALALMTWQIFDPTVWPVMVAMSLGQVLGTASFAAFGYVVFTDYRAQRRADTAGIQSTAPVQVAKTVSGDLQTPGGETPPI
jgi:hypothetical protein